MKNFTFEKTESTGLLTINRPQALNALNRETLYELKDFLENQLKKEGIKVLIFTGSGEKAFIAGADIKEMANMSHTEMLIFCELGQLITKMLEQSDVVTIAAVNGYALGGGLEMALACDFIYASENAKLGLPEVSLGLIPGFGGTQRLSRAVGTRLAKELVFSGKSVDAKTAKEIGIVNDVFPLNELIGKAFETAKKISSNAFFAVKEAKRSINNGYNIPINEALELEKQICAVCFATDDRKEGMTAFVEKRKPNFKN